MKFPSFKEFKNLNFDPLNEVVRYLSVDLPRNLRELSTGLKILKFAENFNSFTVEVTIPANSELAIRNELKKIPTERIILRSDIYQVVDGDTPWNLNYVYMKNQHATLPANVKIVFLE
jgi:hypothetical protein